MNKYMVYYTLDDQEDPFMVEGETLEEAKAEALKELGWHLVKTEDDLEEE